MKKKKILLVTHDFTITGAPLSLLNVAKVLQKDYDISVWGLAGGSLLSQYEEELGIEPLVLSSRYKKYPNFLLSELCKFDFVILNTIVNYKLALVCQKNNIPYMWTIREAQNIIQWHNKKLNKIIKHCQNNIYVVSEYAKEYVDKTYDINVKVIHNLVPDEYVERFNQKISNNLQFTFLGSINRRKGIDLIIEAFSKQQLTNWQLNICGEGKLEYSLKNSSRKCSNIKWLGVVTGDERREIFEKTDVFLVPSLDESCSRVVLEAMMMGCPVVISENVGAKYMVNEHTGWIVKTGDVNSLKECIRDILKNPSEIRAKRIFAREMYLATSTEEIYRKNIYFIIETALKQTTRFRYKRFFNQKFYELVNVIYPLLALIFSITNQIEGSRCRKVITILGIKFKIRNKKREQQMAQAAFRTRSLQIQNALMNKINDMEIILNEQREILEAIVSNEQKNLVKM